MSSNMSRLAELEAAARAELGSAPFDAFMSSFAGVMDAPKVTTTSSMTGRDLISALDETSRRAKAGSPVALRHDSALARMFEANACAQRGDARRALDMAFSSIKEHAVMLPPAMITDVHAAAVAALRADAGDAAAAAVWSTYAPTFDPTTSDPSRQVPVIERALAAHPNDAHLASTLASLSVFTGKRARARELLERALKRDPAGRVGLYYELGKVCEMLSDLPSARANYARFLETAHVDEREFAECCYSLALLVSQSALKPAGSGQQPPSKEALDLFARGQEAERVRLPIYPPCSVPSKGVMQAFIRMTAARTPSEKPGTLSCGACGAPCSVFCSACNNAAYCNATCQRAAWPAHKAACKAAAVEKRAVVLPTSAAEVRALSVDALKDLLRSRRVDFSRCIEKSEIVALALMACRLVEEVD
jgi:tetratricopeptide (TPR) repeat protein